MHKQNSSGSRIRRTMRTMAIGMALILSAVAPTTGDLGVVPPAASELQAEVSFTAPVVADRGTLAARQIIPDRWAIRLGPFEICMHIQCTPGLTQCCNPYSEPTF